MIVTREEGQALAEFGLLAPFLLLALGGVIYFGTLVVTQEHLAMVARHAVRSAALDATYESLARGTDGRAKSSVIARAVSQADDTKTLSVGAAAWPNVAGLKRLDNHTASFVRTKRVRLGNHSYDMGVGCLLYGATIKKDMSKDLSPIARLINAFGGRLANITSAGASAVMPGDLPPRGSKDGSVLGVNNWITGIVNSKNP